MWCFNIRSLSIAVLFLISCVPWPSSGMILTRHINVDNHHIHHNASIHHRSRHRRQGAGLYLAGSYVLPGGEGGGAWGEWGEPSPCSRSCGGGVASQKRICLDVGYDGSPSCTGGDTKYYSCETQDCPADAKDFRAEQCSQHDNELFRGSYHTWVPYTNGPNPCELNCMPRGDRYYYRYAEKVIDGTRCNDESFDVCVNGNCEPVGCDMMLGSNAKEDKCRQCRGNGTNCYTASGLLDTQDLVQGYNDILLIPEGATNIVISEIAPSSNYLALRGKSQNSYYLNGQYHIDFPRSLPIAGCVWNYERNQQGFPAPDKLKALGPTTEPLYLSILIQQENVGIEYEYSIPTALAPPPNQQYNWVFDDFTPCSSTCGGGTQTRTVTCRSREELDVVDDSLCDAGLKPVSNQSCALQPCAAKWVEKPWGPCTKPCGKGGTRSRQVYCEKIVAHRISSLVDDKECFSLLGPKPDQFQECSNNESCPTWFTGPWKPCDHLCGEGKQSRQVVCHQKIDGKVEVLAAEDCQDEKLAEEQSCFLHPCEGVDWVVSEWTGCDTCLSKVRTRTIACATKDHKVVNESFCSNHPAPVLEEDCDPKKMPACTVQWYATQWSNCSVACGKGVQTRRVFCGLFDGSSVLKVDDDRCDNETKYNDTKPCEIPEDKCPAKWFSGPWGPCSKSCGGGEQYRRVMCLSGGEESKDCLETTMLDGSQACNKVPCDKDETLPVDAKTTPIMDDDDYDYCDEEDLIEVDDDDVDEEKLPQREPTTEDPSTLSTDSDEHECMTGQYRCGDGKCATPCDGVSECKDQADEANCEQGNENKPIDCDNGKYRCRNGTCVKKCDGVEDCDSGADESDCGSGDEDNLTLEPDSGSGESSTTDFTSSDTEFTKIGTTETGSTDSGTTGTGSTDSESTESTVTGLTESTISGSSDSSVSGSSDSSASDSSTESSSLGSTTDSNTTDSSTTDASTLDASTIDASTTDSNTTDSSTTNSNTTDSSKTSSNTTDSSTTDSNTTDSSTTDSSTTDSSTTDSNTTDSSTTDASTTDSNTTDSSTTDSSTTDSSTTDSSKTDASTTDSSTTDFNTTDSSTTDSNTTDSSTTDSSTTDSSTKESSTINERTIDASTTDSSTSSTDNITTTGTDTSNDTTTVGTESTESNSTETTLTTGTGTEETLTTGTGTEETLTTGTGTEETLTTGTGTEETLTTGTGTEETWTTGTGTEETLTTGTGTEETLTTGTGTEETLTTGTGTEATGTEPTDTTGTASTDETSVTGSTDESTATEESSSWDWSSTVEWITKRPRCKPRNKKSKCAKTEFGCCPDNRTPAAGPFDEGCLHPKTCKESLFGCCPDGVSPAAGHKNVGCPVPPCAETLYGCCTSDNKTPAEGNSQEGCPPPPPKCKSSKFGCCKDGETEATGLKGKGCPENEPKKSCAKSKFGCCHDKETEAKGANGLGCPCNATEFGCCPDGVTPAAGAQMEGCVQNCNTSAHGCCPDKETPAHGPDMEGCCLLYSYGCCPDNYKPAEGPHLEGCGCQYAHYGCCPDNVTIARGQNKEGCGCQFTENGCCPDRHTPASGPSYEGCDCNTYQFGCCPDGITVAKGQNFQGCHCSQSEHGCCGDGNTAAKGPNQEGCDCSNSKFGCCPDGVTEAKGDKFRGCADVPENRQAGCGLPVDRGPCRNYTVYWFYDMEYGGCSRFWYGGCEGNGNRFSSKEECEDVCVQPPPKDACKLPKVHGACAGYHIRWYYDYEREVCGQFQFGGCLGNANNFENQQLCQAQCEPSSEDACKAPISQGSCAGNFQRWGFNHETGSCEQFIWGGCEGNANRFDTEAACLQKRKWCESPEALKPECTLPPEKGNCSETLARWSFSYSENRCVPFYYTGCNGNENNYETEEQCASRCPSTYVHDTCTLPAETGDCADYRERWYFDTEIQRCRQFYYGGCGGNDNNFVTELECTHRCTIGQATTTTTTTTTTRSAQTPTRNGPERYEFCKEEPDPGPCSENSQKWAYSSREGGCIEFSYGGCGGNRNNFPSKEYCDYYCPQDICQLPMATGPCDDSQPMWFYDYRSETCSQFMYGGCQGNDNRFNTREECESRCRSNTQVATTPQPQPQTQDEIPAQCQIPTSLEQCSEPGQVWYYHPEQKQCVSHLNTASGHECRTTNVFPSEEACERTCGAFQGFDVCRYTVERGPCNENETKYYYDATRDECDTFSYGGCHGGPNRFSTLDECEQLCKVSIDSRFPEVEEECRTPDSLSPCGANSTTYYYDSTRQECLAGEMGNCRYTNGYRSVEECERKCGTFKGLEVCRYNMDPGPCRSAIPKLYYDLATSTCQQFLYGGCHGGPNRFSTLEECEEVCGVPEPSGNEVLPDCDRFNAECSQIDCRYGIQRTRTVDGCERCSCVPVETDCQAYVEECRGLKCNYGVTKTTGADGCERCSCMVHPCEGVECSPGQRCVAEAYRDPVTQEPRYSHTCRTENKPGSCPAVDLRTDNTACRRECNDDADCLEDGKCCQRGCSQLCLAPVGSPTTHRYTEATTYVPELPQAPHVNPQTEPEVTSQEGGVATLRCLFHGNPLPKITWRRGEITIDGDVGRYRLLSDGALEIVSLYRNDSGVYICVAENELGTSRQEIRLQVNDPVDTPAGISGEKDATVFGEIGQSLAIRCLAYGHPKPSIAWYRGHSGPMVPYDSQQYSARDNILLIRQLSLEALGEYECQAYNGLDKPATWSVVVYAYRPYDNWEESPYLIAREEVRVTPPRQHVLYTDRTTVPTPREPEVPVYTVPVATHIQLESNVLAPGAELSIPCDVDGYPTPEVYWTKDTNRLEPSDRVQLTDSRLTISHLDTTDSGVYGCHARNQYSFHYSTVQINVEGMYIPPHCTDSPFFADCALIVRSKYCHHEYYSGFCCKSCFEAGQLTPEELRHISQSQKNKK